MTITRRQFIQHGVALIPVTQLLLSAKENYFLHGVASGDPLQDRVIIWTRITDRATSLSSVFWEIAADKDFKKILFKGEKKITAESDFTVKADITGLKSGSTYFYRFRYKDVYSSTGKTATLPDALKAGSYTVAVVSCNNWEDGYFNSFRFIARRPEVDLVLHLGDYIYEYGTGEYGNPKVDRKNFPAHEIVSLQDYRQRYAQYRTDPDLQELHAAKPFVLVWDDHEIANDTFMDGAKNHQPNEGDFEKRKEAAIQAYLEWLPVRARNAKEMRRTFGVGDDFQLFLTEQRVTGRTQQLTENDPGLHNEDRGIIGVEQLDWLKKQLKESKANWKLVGNQVMFAGYAVKDGFKSPKYSDWWLGYPAERAKLMDFLDKEKIRNAVLLTGDHHESFVLAVHKEKERLRYTKPASVKPLAWEFMTPSITSKNGDRLSAQEISAFEEMLHDKSINPHLVFGDIKSHGYLLMRIKGDALHFDYWYTDNLYSRVASEKLGRSFRVDADSFMV